MPKFTIQRYVCIETEVEAETAEDALDLEESFTVEGKLTCPQALSFDFWISDAIGATVRDEDGEVCLEDWQGYSMKPTIEQLKAKPAELLTQHERLRLHFHNLSNNVGKLKTERGMK